MKGTLEAPNPMEFLAGSYGVVDDRLFSIKGEDKFFGLSTLFREQLLGIPHVRTGRHSVELRNGFGQERFPLESQESSLGGNTLNTFSAYSTVGSLFAQPSGRLHVHPGNELRTRLNALFGTDSISAPIHWLTTPSTLRKNMVFHGPNGHEPLYAGLEPSHRLTPILPAEGDVFISSSGDDLWERILESSPETRIYLAPGSRQIRRGIPEAVMSKLYFLACNLSEARQIAKNLGKQNSEYCPPQELLDYFHGFGIPEIRISAGGDGVFAYLEESGGIHSPGINRDSPLIAHLVKRYLPLDFSHPKQHPNWNGCGDTRLGSELVARQLQFFDEDRSRNARMALIFSNLVASVHSYNPQSNIINFSEQLLWALVNLTFQLHNAQTEKVSPSPQ